MKNELIEQAQQTLWSRDFLGYNFEMGNIEVLKKHGLYKYVVYRNPKNPILWKKKKGMGVDMVLKRNGYAVYVEESFCGSEYPYRKNWFEKCRLPRFKGYRSDAYHIKVILTNKPRNFESVKQLAKQHEIRILTIRGLLRLIRRLSEVPRFIVCSLVKYLGVSVDRADIHKLFKKTPKQNQYSKHLEPVYAHGKQQTSNCQNYALNLIYALLKGKIKLKEVEESIIF